MDLVNKQKTMYDLLIILDFFENSEIILPDVR